MAATVSVSSPIPTAVLIPTTRWVLAPVPAGTADWVMAAYAA